MNNSILEWLKAAIGAAGGALAYVFGPWDALATALVCAVTIDYVSGLIKAAIKRELSSSVGFKGLLKKVLIFAVVGMAAVVDRTIPAANQAIRSAVMIFYIANEGISILENAGEMGLPLPQTLKNMLIKVKEDSNGKSE